MSADVYKLRVGVVLPGQVVNVSIVYVTDVAVEGENLRFVVPTSVGPRYSALPTLPEARQPEEDSPSGSQSEPATGSESGSGSDSDTNSNSAGTTASRVRRQIEEVSLNRAELTCLCHDPYLPLLTQRYSR
jgi:hypothetical protein